MQYYNVNTVEPHSLMIMRPPETQTTRVSLLRKVPHIFLEENSLHMLWINFVLGFNFISRLIFPQNPFNAYFDSLRSMAVLLGALLSGEAATKIDPSLQ